jgi:serine/threonine protein kinase
LFDRICDKELYNEQDARQLAKVLISILACLHGKSIAHRDIKPEVTI